MSSSSLLSQLEVELQTGLSREVLRKWELRYDFPAPVRGLRGQRLYSCESVEKLKLIRRLIAQGLRPSGLAALPHSALQEFLERDRIEHERDSSLACSRLLTCLQQDAEPTAVREFLQKLIESEGLPNFMDWYFADFNASVGEAWARGKLGIHAEHHYSESVRKAISQVTSAMQRRANAVRVLLTTPPGEIHSLGLLGVEATLALRGADCATLGLQTPVGNVVQAAIGFKVSVVAVSLSVFYPKADAVTYIKELRRSLSPDIRLWAGGAGAGFMVSNPVGGVEVFSSCAEVRAAWDAHY